MGFAPLRLLVALWDAIHRENVVVFRQNTMDFHFVASFLDDFWYIQSHIIIQTHDPMQQRGKQTTAFGGLMMMMNALMNLVESTMSVDLDLALEKIMKAWFQLHSQQIQAIHSIFELVDQNGDGTLDFQEFCEIVNVLEPNISRRDALSLYQKAAGEDQVIDRNEFVLVMLENQRSIILKELYEGENQKKMLSGIQQRKEKEQLSFSALASSASASSSSTAQGKARRESKSKTKYVGRNPLAVLEREDSFVSLTEAVDIATLELEDTAQQEQDDQRVVISVVQEEEDEGETDENDHSSSTKASAAAAAAAVVGLSEHLSQLTSVEENVSYSTLTRLTMWASEAKEKLALAQGASLRTLINQKKKAILEEFQTQEQEEQEEQAAEEEEAEETKERKEKEEEEKVFASVLS